MAIITLKNLNVTLSNLTKAGVRFDTTVQDVAVFAIHHANEHGDVGPAERLLRALPAGSRVSACKKYLIASGVFSDSKDGLKVKKLASRALDEAVLEQHWTEYKAPAKDKPAYDFNKALAAFLKKAETEGADAAMLAKLAAAAAAM